ncbi:MAG: hypothetical protein KME19_20575 [Microcoleus vaginatus WJT46-NPBG5]|jgi:hypothetical protein|nr:hypothetical protein [Microcoleus vaginatus WJT46-NPBG5]
MGEIQAKVLFVEGKRDLWVIPPLMKANGVPWQEDKPSPVEIIALGGYDKLTPEKISANLKGSRLTGLGLIVDADKNSKNRWQSVRQKRLESIPDIPKKLPDSGLIHTTKDGQKFGVWIMPDNQLQGMLETFLADMIPDESEILWNYAQEAAREAKNRGAPFSESHIDKAYIYTWLAWQDKPGEHMNDAIKKKIINPKHPKAQMFVNWFKTLYEF